MLKLKEMTDAHIAVYAIEANEVARILRNGKPQTGDQFEAHGTSSKVTARHDRTVLPNRVIQGRSQCRRLSRS